MPRKNEQNGKDVVMYKLFCVGFVMPQVMRLISWAYEDDLKEHARQIDNGEPLSSYHIDYLLISSVALIVSFVAHVWAPLRAFKGLWDHYTQEEVQREVIPDEVGGSPEVVGDTSDIHVE